MYRAGLGAHDGKDFIHSAVWQAGQITRNIRSRCTQCKLENDVESILNADRRKIGLIDGIVKGGAQFSGSLTQFAIRSSLKFALHDAMRPYHRNAGVR